MLKDKKIFALFLALAFVLMTTIWAVSTGVLAQTYNDPDTPPPGGNVDLNFLENPLTEDLDLSGFNLNNANDIHANRLIMNAGSLDITSSPANANETKWAFGATASKVNSSVNARTYGLYSKTITNSGSNPSYAVFAEANNAGGIAVYGKANNGYAVYGETANTLSTPGVFGLGSNGVFGQSNKPGGAGVYGHAGTGDYAGYFDGMVLLANGGQLYVETENDLSPIVGVASYDGVNAGVQGYGNVGIYGGGDVVGVYGYGEQGVLAKGARTISIIPPPGGEFNEEPIENGVVISLLGANHVQAAVGNYTPYTIGLIAAGGSNGGGTLTHAGLGLCALSGAKDFALGDSPNYYNYCQDTNGKNNYAGFFAGDVYLKDGSLQIRGSLTAANENLIYGNASSAAAGSHLIKLQNNGLDKFRVSKDGAGYFASSLSASDLNADGSLFLNSDASYIDFRGGISAPSCKAGEEGIVYYFSNYNSLCLCRGASGWANLVPGLPNGMCTNGTYFPS
ncbi:hypothetical protein H6761_02515 [Candidatus Nomurabacteria bacterium]|nr:hypothetical protein [Candidatus Nomurabacteria bacterium]